MRRLIAELLTAGVLLLSVGCRRDMARQPYARPLQTSPLFENGMSSRPIPEHAVAQELWSDDELFSTGREKGELAKVFPAPVTREQLERGRERYDIFCAECHGPTGAGDGMIVQRGFPAPPTFHQDRLRDVPPGHLFEVITKGFGVMYPYGSRVEPADRWAIAAYIRALQLSQRATVAEAEPDARAGLEGTK